MSRSGAVMILVIAVVRALTINKLPKKSFLALWGVAAARLLIPYSLPSAFSVYSLVGRFVPTAEVGDAIPTVPFVPVAPENHMISQPVTPQPAAPAAHTTAIPIDPWMIVWLVGALLCAAFFATAYLKCRREFMASLPVDNEYAKHWLSEHRSYRTIEIRQSGRISAPLTYGVVHPVILMPKTADWNDLDTLNYVLTHEYVHIRRFDAVTKLVLTAAACVHWFNPAVWIMYVLANRDIELSCDETVIRQFGERTKSAYAMTLICMEETRSGLTPLCNNFSKNAIEERIIAIMKMKKKSTAVIICAAMLVAGISAVFATSPKPVETKNMEDLPSAVMTTQTVKPAPAPTPVEQDIPQTTPSVSDTSDVLQTTPTAPDMSMVKQDVPQNTTFVPNISAVPQSTSVTSEQDPESVQQPVDTSAESVVDTAHKETYEEARTRVSGESFSKEDAEAAGMRVLSKEEADAMFNSLCEKWLVNGEYPKTADGKTYGPSMLYKVVGEEPDLILVRGDNGMSGFVTAEDRDPTAHLKTPEEVVEYFKTHPSGERTVPVYDLEGNVIDTFTFHTGEVGMG